MIETTSQIKKDFIDKCKEKDVDYKDVLKWLEIKESDHSSMNSALKSDTLEELLELIRDTREDIISF